MPAAKGTKKTTSQRASGAAKSKKVATKTAASKASVKKATTERKKPTSTKKVASKTVSVKTKASTQKINKATKKSTVKASKNNSLGASAKPKAPLKKTSTKTAAPKKAPAKTGRSSTKSQGTTVKTSATKSTLKKKTSADKSKITTTTVSIQKSTKPKDVPKKVTPVAMPEERELPVGSGFMGIPPYEILAEETYMNERQKAHFQHILLTWRRALLEEVERTVSNMKDEVINFPDLNDRASLEEEFSLELRTRDREHKLIKKIDDALGHIQDDQYGYCDVCGIEIGIRRLEARPTATQCIDCKTLAEIKERQLKG